MSINGIPTHEYEDHCLTAAWERAGIAIEPQNVYDICPITELGQRVANYFNINIADSPSMMITAREGEALAAFVIGES